MILTKIDIVFGKEYLEESNFVRYILEYRY